MTDQTTALSLNAKARMAGLLYLLVVITGMFQLLYVPSQIFVHGNTAATISNIVAHETLFRTGMVVALWSAVIELFLVLALYRLFKGVDRNLAILMVILGGVTLVAIDFSVLYDAAALMLARGGDFLSAFDKPQRDALAMLFLRLDTQQMFADEIFWGLWLFPLGMLVWKSRMVPRFLGAWLILNGVAYLVESFTGLLLPRYADAVSNVMFPVQFGEVAFMLWLLAFGARCTLRRASARLPATST